MDRRTTGWIPVGLFLACLPGLLEAGDPRIEADVAALQRKYSGMRDLQMDFVQSYGWPGRRPRTESGQVFLRRPGLMRWEYREPEEKLFLSDGETIHFYLPGRKQVQKSRVGRSRDRRLPFLFLLGRGRLKRDFSRIEWAREEPFFAGNRVLAATPGKSAGPLAEVLMEYDPGRMQLQRVALIERGGARNDFIFTNIRENAGLDKGLFEFQAPADVEAVGLP
ncbi:MAG: outer membrane lipoprotein carrier protein LolA [Acidobacteriota bacterium]|nr:outer membrane lipoprotein carrier protein LolA [Acidobacteriota bacterium]